MKAEEAAERIVGEQLRLISEKYGKAAQANVGWGQVETESYVRVETKVYTNPRMVLVSSASAPDWSTKHAWYDYEGDT